MAEEEQKTLDPTPKKLEDARKRGDVPSAPEMRHAAMFAAMVLIVVALGASAITRLAAQAEALWGRAGEMALTGGSTQRLATTLLGGTLIAVSPLLAVTLGAALVGALLQGRGLFVSGQLKLKWDRLSPMTGAKRLFGRQAWVEFAKTLAKFAFVAIVAGAIVWPALDGLDRMTGANASDIGRFVAGVTGDMLSAVALLVAALAAGDFLYQRRSWLTRLRMSHQEVRDEHKQNEGDPQIKARIRAIGMARARRRMMSAVPSASVVITNPTHYAVALRYDHGAMQAPVVVAKGRDRIALRIRELAGEHKVPVVESPPLARALYASVEIDQPIKLEHYAAVAEIISYVLRLTRGKKSG
ncbi:flagellar biosynthesis protein FlhB [Sphingobium sp. DEHP117]|uniref:flagellar biosynthesis protein FlhB n=1 Tax=Sphingobium sp. DEHP117 TaxID=2993436 RepID=UPI0027D76460|nr:flagellar biosynthesis protein FlhB [Sphingobium sp. DEHP117]MDQ4420670.1 flagellar biosynthesis protein FlhB [Sphingobium sp. DEHP117]